jgi:hypothetical protein
MSLRADLEITIGIVNTPFSIVKAERALPLCATLVALLTK